MRGFPLGGGQGSLKQGVPPAKQTWPSLGQSSVPWAARLTPASGLSQAGLVPFPVLCRGTSPVSGSGSALRGGLSKGLHSWKIWGALRDPLWVYSP